MQFFGPMHIFYTVLKCKEITTENNRQKGQKERDRHKCRERDNDRQTEKQTNREGDIERQKEVESARLKRAKQNI